MYCIHYIYSAQLVTAFSDTYMGPGLLPGDDGDPLLPDPVPRLVLRLVVGHLARRVNNLRSSQSAALELSRAKIQVSVHHSCKKSHEIYMGVVKATKFDGIIFMLCYELDWNIVRHICRL